MRKGLVAVGVSFVLAACIHAVRTPPSQQDLQQAYSRAVRDAQVAEPEEVSRTLIAIRPENPLLIWSDDGERVLVVTWTSWDGYDSLVGTSFEVSRDVWVTAAPEVKEFCRGLHQPPADVALRLEQILGLPPGSGKTRFVELWVQPNDLFRPSPDPEISDQEAEVDFPVSTRYVAISQDYVKWFDDLKSRSYGPDGYPWTRLGYTYDWGNVESEVGLSEFVVRNGADVSVNAVIDTQAYCD